MTTQIIHCDSCSFEGKLIYKNDDFSKADICYCPACGGDILEEYADPEHDADSMDSI